MKFFNVLATFLTVGFAAASPTVVGNAVQHVERADVPSFGNSLAQTNDLGSVVDSQITKSSTPSNADLGQITDKLNKLLKGLVPLNTDFLTGGDITDILGIVNRLGEIVSDLIKGIPLLSGGGLLRRSPQQLGGIFGEVWEIINLVSKVVNEVLRLVYGASVSSKASDNADTVKQLQSGGGNLSGGLGGLLGLLPGLLH